MGKQKVRNPIGIQLKNNEAVVILGQLDFENYCRAENCKIFWTNPEEILGPFSLDDFETMDDDQICEGIDDIAATFTIAIQDEDGEWSILKRNAIWIELQHWFEDLTDEQIAEYSGRWYHGTR